jgi:hypothetical protein
MGGSAGLLLVTGASWVKKWEVHPESAIMGAIGGLEFLLLTGAIMLALLATETGPDRQARLLPVHTLSLPPSLLVAVAASKCPGLRRWHVSLVCSTLLLRPWVQQ